MYRLAMVTVLSSVAYGVCIWAPADEPALTFRFSGFQHPEDLAESRFEADVLRVTVLSSRGFGRGTITPQDKNWPDRVEIFLAGLTELESLQLESGRFSTSGHRRQSGQFPFTFLTTTREARQKNVPAKPPTPAGTLDIQVRQTEGGILVTLPEKLLVDKDSLQLAWIDWLRI